MYNPEATTRMMAAMAARTSVPVEKQEPKARNTVCGIVLAVVGFICMAAGAVVVLVLKDAGIPLVTLAALFVLAGVYFFGAGMNMMSGEAMDAMAQDAGFFPLLFKLLRYLPKVLAGKVNGG